MMDNFNPKCNGNCSFRALAKEVYGSQEEWIRVKNDLQGMYLKDAELFSEMHALTIL
jgi:hypothetical protein